MNSKEFSLKIEGIVKEKKISHMDAVVWYCDQNGLDTSQVSSLISKSLKEYDKLKEKQHFITDKSLIDIIDNMERLVRALRKHIVRTDI